MDQTEKATLEYSTLRQEILYSINACDTYKIAMYTITVAILSFGFTHSDPAFFLLPYTVIFAFQWAISRKNDNNMVISAYISVYLEDECGWESNNFELKKEIRSEVPDKVFTSVFWRLVGRISSAQLGFICSSLGFGYSAYNLFTAKTVIECVWSAICLVLSVIFYMGIHLMTKDVLALGNKRERYVARVKSYKEAELKKLQSVDSLAE